MECWPVGAQTQAMLTTGKIATVALLLFEQT